RRGARGVSRARPARALPRRCDGEQAPGGGVKDPMAHRIPFNKPFVSGQELEYISQAVGRGELAADGHFTKACAALIKEQFGAHKVLMTPSCTAALEMAALLCDVGPGDEVIVPSYTFVSTVNAFVLRG